MSKVTGKVLLRNVMRQTDAHNKIQEESEMWKLRQWEKQTSQHKHLPATECMRGRMHCDRAADYSRDQVRSKERASCHDDREARYWTRKLYQFEANDPDRWGHSGFKELYPEEFASDSEEASSTKNGHHKKKKSKSSTDAAKPKRSKKSSRKKKKKKKKDEEEKRKRGESSSSSDESSAIRCKQGRKRPKSKHKNKKRERSREREKDSSSEESDDEGERERRTRSRKKRKQDSHKGSDSGVDSQKRRRKNWKAANEENTDDSSGD